MFGFSGKEKLKVSLGRTVLLVHDFEEALNFYQNLFGCHTLFDQVANNGKRYLHIGFDKSDVGLWLLKADTPFQQSLVGKQSGGQPMLVFYTNQLDTLLERARKMNAEILKVPAQTGNARFFHLGDLYGNELVIIELED